MLAAQAQTLANADVSNAQRTFTGGGGGGGGGGNTGRGARRHHHRQHPVRRAARRHRRQRRRRRLELDDVRRLGRRAASAVAAAASSGCAFLRERACLRATRRARTGLRARSRRLRPLQLELDAAHHFAGPPSDVVGHDRHHRPAHVEQSSALLSITPRNASGSLCQSNPSYSTATFRSGQAKSTRHTAGPSDRSPRTAVPASATRRRCITKRASLSIGDSAARVWRAGSARGPGTMPRRRTAATARHE